MTIIPPTVAAQPVFENYAPFMGRFTALMIDRIILFFVGGFALFILGGVTTVGSLMMWPVLDGSFEWQGRWVDMSSSYFQLAIIDWVYFAAMESSAWQATIGKRMMGIFVVSAITGERLPFMRASVRYFGKYLSSMIAFFGFVMALFTFRHQALHDMIAETLVLTKIKGVK